MHGTPNGRPQPRNGTRFQALGVNRISTDKQRGESLDAQKAQSMRFARDLLGVEPEWTWISTRGSGEHLDRPELDEIEQHIRSGRFDVLITEHIDRLIRDIEVMATIQLCVAHGVRVVTPRGFDTANDSWVLTGSILAAMAQEEQEKTSARIKRTLRFSFEQGGYLHNIPWGYEWSPPEGYEGGKHEQHVHPIPECTAVFRRIVDQLWEGLTFVEIAKRLRADGTPSPSSSGFDWTATMIRRIVGQLFRSGRRCFGKTTTKKNLENGHRVSTPQEAGKLVWRETPHWKMIEPEEHDALLVELERRNARYQRPSKPPGTPPMPRQPVFPAPLLICAACGRAMRVFSMPGAKGTKAERRRMNCSARATNECFNSGCIRHADVLDLIHRRILEVLGGGPGAGSELEADINAEIRRQSLVASRTVSELEKQIEDTDRKIERLLALAESGQGTIEQLSSKLEERRRERSELVWRLERERSTVRPEVVVPSADEVRRLAEDAISTFDPCDPEVYRNLKRMMPSMTAYPFRLLDAGKVFVFIHVRLDLRGLVPGLEGLACAENAWTHEFIVPAFAPPPRLLHVARVRQLQAEGSGVLESARQLGVQPREISKARKLIRLMDERGTSCPFAPITDVSQVSQKVVQRMKIRFRPKKGYAPWDGSLEGLPPLPEF